MQQKLNIPISAENRYSGELSRAERAFKAAGGAMVTSLKVGAVAAAAAIGTFSVAAYKAVQAANEVDAIEKQLATALGYTSQALLDQAGALQKVTTFGDDQIVQAQAMIAMFVKDEEQIKAATRATLDFAAAKGVDLKTAADLISKTLGSSTNALSRYGIQVEGAVGSTERLESLTKGMAEAFGGQAAAAAETFGGKLTQVSNIYGDLWEEIGFVITRNQFFIKGLDMVKGAMSGLADKIKENRLWLMELTKSGILSLVKGMGYALEVMRAFHNGWNGIKLVANFAVVGIADGLRLVLEALNAVLYPLKLAFDGLVKFGVMDSNPIAAAFDAGREAVSNFQASSRDVFDDTLKDIVSTDLAYKKVKDTIKGIETSLRSLQVAQAAVAAEAADAQVEAYRRYQTQQKAKEAAAAKEAAKAQEAAQGQLGSLADPTAQASEDVFAQAWAGYQSKLAALDQYNAQRLQLMQAAGYSEAELAAENARMVMDLEEKKRDFQLAAASQVFGGLSSMMQNLTVLTGKEGGAAFTAMKGFAIAETTINTYRAAQGSYAALSGIPIIGPALGTAAAAAAVVAGLARVKQIASMQPGGSASGSTISSGGTANPTYSGGSPSAYPAPTRTDEPRQALTVTMNIAALDPSSINWDEMMEKQIAPALERLSGDRDVALKIKVASR